MQLLVSMHETSQVSMFYHSCVQYIILNIAIIMNIKKFFLLSVPWIITIDLCLRGRTRIVHSAKIIQICQIIVDKIEILLLSMQKTGLSRSIFQGWGIWNAAIWDVPKSLVHVLMIVISAFDSRENQKSFISMHYYLHQQLSFLGHLLYVGDLSSAC